MSMQIFNNTGYWISIILGPSHTMGAATAGNNLNDATPGTSGAPWDIGPNSQTAPVGVSVAYLYDNGSGQSHDPYIKVYDDAGYSNAIAEFPMGDATSGDVVTVDESLVQQNQTNNNTQGDNNMSFILKRLVFDDQGVSSPTIFAFAEPSDWNDPGSMINGNSWSGFQDPNADGYALRISIDGAEPSWIGSQNVGGIASLPSPAGRGVPPAGADEISAAFAADMGTQNTAFTAGEYLIEISESYWDPNLGEWGANAYVGWSSLGTVTLSNDNGSITISEVTLSGGDNPFSGIDAGDYPLADIGTNYQGVDRLATTQMKQRMWSSQPEGYRPRHKDSEFLAQGFITNMKSMTILAAKNAGHISQSEYDYMKNDHGMQDADMVPEVPLVMMLDSYRSSIARLLDADLGSYFDSESMIFRSESDADDDGSGRKALKALQDMDVVSDTSVLAALTVAQDLTVTQNFEAVNLSITAGTLEVGNETDLGNDPVADQVNLSSSLSVGTTTTFQKLADLVAELAVLDQSGDASGFGMRITESLSIPAGGWLHVKDQGTPGSTLDDAQINAKLKVLGLLDVDGSALFQSNTPFGMFTLTMTGEGEVRLWSTKNNPSDADEVQVHVRADNAQGGVTVEANLITITAPYDSAEDEGGTEVTGNLIVGGSLSAGQSSADKAYLGDHAADGTFDSSKSDAALLADKVTMSNNLDVSLLSKFEKKVDVGNAGAVIAGNVVINKDDKSTDGSVLDGNLTVTAGNVTTMAGVAGSSLANHSGDIQVGRVQDSDGNALADGLASSILNGAVTIGDGAFPAVSIADLPAGSGHHNGDPNDNGFKVDASGRVSIVSEDESNPDADDIDIKIIASDGAGSVEIYGKDGVKLKGDATIDSETKMHGHLIIDLPSDWDDTEGAGPDGMAFKIRGGGQDRVTIKANTSGATPVGDAVFSNFTPPADPLGGKLSVNGALNVTGKLLTPSAGGVVQAQILQELEMKENIFSLSHESPYLHFLEALDHIGSHGVSELALKSAAIQAHGGDAPADLPAAQTAWDELTLEQKMLTTEGVDLGGANSGGIERGPWAEIPRTAVDPDGIYFYRTTSAESHSDHDDYITRHINTGARQLIVTPGHGDKVGSDDTVMSIISSAPTILDAKMDGTITMEQYNAFINDGATDSDLYHPAAHYLDIQLGGIYLDNLAVFTGVDDATTWNQILLMSKRRSAAEFAAAVEAFNWLQTMVDPGWTSMTAVQVESNLKVAAGEVNGSTFSLPSGTPDISAQLASAYSAADFMAANQKFRVVDNAMWKGVGSTYKVESTGKLKIKDEGVLGSQASSALVVDGTSPSAGAAASAFAQSLHIGTQASTPDLLTIYPDGDRASEYIQLDGSRQLNLAVAEGDATNRAAHLGGEGTLRSSDGSHDLDMNGKSARIIEKAVLHGAASEFQARALGDDAIGLSIDGQLTELFGDTLVKQDVTVVDDLYAGEFGTGVGKTMVFDHDGVASEALNRISVDLGTSRTINSASQAEFELTSLVNGEKADALIGGSIALDGTTRKSVIAEKDIWFGKILSSEAEFLMQDHFTDGSNQMIGGVEKSFKDLSGTDVAVHGYVLSKDQSTLIDIIRSGVDVLDELSWYDAQLAGVKSASQANDALVAAGVVVDTNDPAFDAAAVTAWLQANGSGSSTLNVMKTVVAAQNASAGMSHQENIQSFYKIDDVITMSEAFHAIQVGGSISDGDVVPYDDAKATKGRLEIYLNGMRLPDSEYDLIASTTDSGKKIAFKRPIERRDVIIIDSKVANPG